MLCHYEMLLVHGVIWYLCVVDAAALFRQVLLLRRATCGWLPTHVNVVFSLDFLGLCNLQNVKFVLVCFFFSVCWWIYQLLTPVLILILGQFWNMKRCLSAFKESWALFKWIVILQGGLMNLTLVARCHPRYGSKVVVLAQMDWKVFLDTMILEHRARCICNTPLARVIALFACAGWGSLSNQSKWLISLVDLAIALHRLKRLHIDHHLFPLVSRICFLWLSFYCLLVFRKSLIQSTYHREFFSCFLHSKVPCQVPSVSYLIKLLHVLYSSV